MCFIELMSMEDDLTFRELMSDREKNNQLLLAELSYGKI